MMVARDCAIVFGSIFTTLQFSLIGIGTCDERGFSVLYMSMYVPGRCARALRAEYASSSAKTAMHLGPPEEHKATSI